MRNVLQIAFAGVLLCISSAASHADPADDWVHAFMAKTQAPGVALAVIRDRKVVKAGIYGYANLEWQPLGISCLRGDELVPQHLHLGTHPGRFRLCPFVSGDSLRERIRRLLVPGIFCCRKTGSLSRRSA